MSFFLLKYVHIISVAASFSLLFVRGLWVMRAYPDSQEQWVRMLPHAVDGLLVASGVGVMIFSAQKGWPGDWLTLKLALIVLYVAMAQGLFRVARALFVKALMWVLALSLFLFITTIALLRNPLGIFSVL